MFILNAGGCCSAMHVGGRKRNVFAGGGNVSGLMPRGQNLVVPDLVTKTSHGHGTQKKRPNLYCYRVGSLDFNVGIPLMFPFNQQKPRKQEIKLGDLQHPRNCVCLDV